MVLTRTTVLGCVVHDGDGRGAVASAGSHRRDGRRARLGAVHVDVVAGAAGRGGRRVRHRLAAEALPQLELAVRRLEQDALLHQRAERAGLVQATA